MRQVQITLKNEQNELIQKVLEIIKADFNIKHTTLLKGDSNTLIMIRQKRTIVPELIERLEDIGIGTKFGIIDILSLEATIPELIEKFDEKKDIVPDRIALEEIKSDIEEGAKPSLNYFVFVILSAIVASAGLILNSPAVVIASMIISPLMGPILGLSFGIAISNGKIMRDSTIAQVFGILISICCGILLGGLTILFIKDSQITSEMSARYFPSYLDIIIAVCAGIAVGFGITGTVQSNLVGAAIALSLMPPAVNVGLALIYGNLSLSFGSLILLLANIMIINACTMIVLKMKKVHRLP
jgi:uncharacterized hydrophobic protein (TIGR00271 family)